MIGVLSKRISRWIAATLASSVCTVIGMSGALFAYADTEGCTLKDVAAWKAQLTDPQEEASPLYRLSVTEAFISDCPARPEVVSAHQLAGIAAMDGGFAEETIVHLEKARAPYRPLEIRPWFGLIAALLETGEDQAAWEERDALVAHWLERLESDGLASIETLGAPGGHIHAVEFIALEPRDFVRGVWLAVPEDAGWPSAIVLGSDGFRAALHLLRQPNTPRLEHIDLIGCKERITLTQAEGEIAFDVASEAAIAASERYLERPELPVDNGAVDMSSACTWPDKMLPRPDPYVAELID